MRFTVFSRLFSVSQYTDAKHSLLYWGKNSQRFVMFGLVVRPNHRRNSS